MFNKTGAVLALGIFLAGCQISSAQHLGSLWEEVKSSYPGINNYEAQVNAAEHQAKAITGERLPQLKTQAQNTYGTYNGIMGAFFPQPGLFNVSGNENLLGAKWTPNSYASATLEWEFFSFGKMHHKSKAAKANTKKAMSEQEAYFLQLKKELSNRYIQLLYNESQLTSNQQNVERLNTLRTITGALSRAGLKTEADSLLSSSSYNQALGENLKLKGQLQAALIKLAELTEKQELNYATSIEQFLNPTQLPPEKKILMDQDHPVLKSIDARREHLESLAKSENRSALPSFNLLGGYAFRGSGIGTDGTVSDKWGDGFDNSVNNGLVGIGLTWNLSDLYTKKQKGSSFKQQAESQKYVHEQFEKQLQADLSAFQKQIENQYLEVEKTLHAEEQAQRAYEMYLARYKSGLMDLSSLLQIQLLLEQAEKTHINAAYEYWLLLAAEAELIADFSHLFNNL